MDCNPLSSSSFKIETVAMKNQHCCRCCLSQDCYKDMRVEYSFGETSEVYCDMLKATFDIQISKEEGVKSLICESCIARLRDAIAFKRQVIESEESFKQLSQIEDLGTKTEFKEEYEHFDDGSDRLSDNGDDNDPDWEIGDREAEKDHIPIVKSEDEKVKKKRKIAKPKSAVTSTKKKKKSPDKKLLAECDEETIDIKPKNKRIREPKLEISEIHQNQCDNTLKLMENSNMCPFKSLRTKFGCFACKTNFLDVQDLKEHTNKHYNSTNQLYLTTRVKQMRGLTYRNVEISDLKCNICEGNCTDLTDLRTHLESHGVKFSGTDHFLIPYKLKDGYECVMCNDKFHSYTRLSIHMNSHYKYNVCEICGQSFINRVSLRTHLNRMHKEKKCTICAVEFFNNKELAVHMKKMHDLYKEKRYCPVCNISFRHTYQLEKHKLKEHGWKRPVSKCLECDKTFPAPRNLKNHIRGVHRKERKYPCGSCGMLFYLKRDQRRHEAVHENLRTYACDCCSTKFKSKESCRRHLKKQHGQIFGRETLVTAIPKEIAT